MEDVKVNDKGEVVEPAVVDQQKVEREQKNAEFQSENYNLFRDLLNKVDLMDKRQADHDKKLFEYCDHLDKLENQVNPKAPRGPTMN